MLHVPLRGRQATAGVLTLATSHPRRLVAEDLVLAQELARRISLVLENARAEPPWRRPGHGRTTQVVNTTCPSAWLMAGPAAM